MEFTDRHPIPSSEHNHIPENSEIKRSKRDTPPAHFILKIKSFSQLSEIVEKKGHGKYESDEFEAGDYKWKLVMYPNGNLKADGEGHISLYLASTDKKTFSSTSTHVNVLVSFFVYNHIRDTYLTIQDGKIKRYHILRTEHGFDQLFPLTEFNDSTNGYLIDDCCVFGAEVHVIKNTVKINEFSLIKYPPDGIFTWKIDNFSALALKSHSDVFSAGGYRWKLAVYPKGKFEKDRALSLYLNLEANSATRRQTKVYAEYELLIKNQINGIHRERKASDWFGPSDSFGNLVGWSWGYPRFIVLNKLHDASNGFLVNDTLIIEAKITRVSISKDLVS